MPKSIHDRIAAIVAVLERLATDVEVIRQGSEALASSLPSGCEVQCHLLATQSAALERISIALGMVLETATSLGEIREHAEIILEEVRTLTLVKTGLDMVIASGGTTEDWHPAMLERATFRFQQCVERICAEAALLAEKTPPQPKRPSLGMH